MEQKSIPVLLVEDSSFDAKLIQDLFAGTDLAAFTLTHAKDLTEAFHILDEKRFDVILLDITLPEAMGLETFGKMYAYRPAIPIIVLTRFDDENLAVQSVDLGAQDYLIKGQVDAGVLKRSIRYGIERKQLVEELRRHMEHLEELVKARTSELIEIIKRLKQEIDKRTEAEQELTEAFNQLKGTQAQLIQAEKMESVGRLASGIAHEVKNPLAILMQGVEYLSKKTAPIDKNVASIITDMTEAINRADSIIKGFLDFSGVSQLELKNQELAPIVEKALLLLKHEFDIYHIDVVREFSEGLPLVAVDRNKMEQVFINIFENATHAMPKGGQLKVVLATEKISKIEEGVGKRKGDLFKPGEQVVVARVEDNGSGIPENFLDKVFDPFFTTKRNIGGTGLGLSIVRNIIETHQGKIKITNKDREEGTGVRVTILFKQEPKGG